MTENPRLRAETIVRNGTVIDGAGGPRVRADVAVADGRIAALGELSATQAEREIDAAGRVVAPGFIDVHTHDDRALLSSPEMAMKVSQGVTTVVIGNCGGGPNAAMVICRRATVGCFLAWAMRLR